MSFFHHTAKTLLVLLACLVFPGLSIREVIVGEFYKFQFELFNNDTSIRFWLSANTTGWVGIGFGPQKNMTGADLFIGGYNSTTENITERAYGGDYFATGNGLPELDTIQDWLVENAGEPFGVTMLQVSRLLTTGDTHHDIDITNTTINVLCAIGAEDDLDYHGGARAVVEVNLVWDDETETRKPKTLNNIGNTSVAVIA